ncbi:CDP-alcohol phosphatidyltransferase family protein [Terrihabitans sp. B22-R8]|uniref:CDP-alcohol phosphatidyltransferase family protein n=1 Tax=Terrihabitans sp. B22-R8 TaxID=3425128 RepID=UPI00403CA24D
MMFVNLPTFITILRIFAVPLVVWLILGGYDHAAFWLFVAAGLSDAIDGYLARAWDQRTRLGAYLDPLADKALLVSIYLTLGFGHAIPIWLAIGVVARDIMIVGAVLLSWLLDHPVVIKPLMISKLNTAAQIGFAALALAIAGFDIQAGSWFVVAGWIVGALTLVSAAAYLATWTRHMARPEDRL